MALSNLQRALLETNAQRDRAEAVLESLQRAKRDVERQLDRLQREDALAQVTGRSSLDDAIESTQRMIDTLNRALETMRSRVPEREIEPTLVVAAAAR